MPAATTTAAMTMPAIAPPPRLEEGADPEQLPPHTPHESLTLLPPTTPEQSASAERTAKYDPEVHEQETGEEDVDEEAGAAKVHPLPVHAEGEPVVVLHRTHCLTSWYPCCARAVASVGAGGTLANITVGEASKVVEAAVLPVAVRIEA